MYQTLFLDERSVRVALLLSIFLTTIPFAAFSGSTELARYEGGWGFDSFESTPGYWAEGFKVEGACGAPKQFRFTFREESNPDGSLFWYLRRHPDQADGELITSVSATRLVTEFLGDSTVFELRKDGRLAFNFFGTRMLLRRCR
jgi:hypothetical protein